MKRSCMFCQHKDVCIQRSAALFMLYIQTGRYDEVEDGRKHLDVSAECSSFSWDVDAVVRDAGIQKVGCRTAWSIIETREPKGEFCCTEDGKYVGIDNQTGDAWTEEFDSEIDCIRWLTGEEEDDDVRGHLVR